MGFVFWAIVILAAATGFLTLGYGYGQKEALASRAKSEPKPKIPHPDYLPRNYKIVQEFRREQERMNWVVRDKRGDLPQYKYSGLWLGNSDASLTDMKEKALEWAWERYRSENKSESIDEELQKLVLQDEEEKPEVKPVPKNLFKKKRKKKSVSAAARNRKTRKPSSGKRT